jgi:hypothetical protein
LKNLLSRSCAASEEKKMFEWIAGNYRSAASKRLIADPSTDEESKKEWKEWPAKFFIFPDRISPYTEMAAALG